MNRKIIATLAVAYLASAGLAHAQDSDSLPLRVPCMKGDYITAEAGAGLQTINYDLLQPGSTDNGFGLDLKLGYRHYFLNHFGLGIGLRFQNYKGLATVDYVQRIQNAVIANYSYTHVTEFNDLQEKQNAGMLELPIEAFFQWNISNRWKLNLGLGAQVNMLAVNRKYKVSSGTVSTTGIDMTESGIAFDGQIQNLKPGFVFSDGEYSDLPTDGFVTDPVVPGQGPERPNTDQYFSGDVKVPNGKYDYKVTLSGIAEIGLMYAINKRVDFTFNINAGYGFNTLCTNYSSRYLYDPECTIKDGQQPTYDGHYNGLLNTQAEKPRLMSIGATAGVRIRINRELPPDVDFTGVSRSRRHRDTEGMDINITDNLEFDEVQRKKREADSIALAEQERQKRITEGIDVVQPADSIQDSQVLVADGSDAAGINADLADDNSQSMPADETPAPDNSAEAMLSELDDILSRLNKNNCDFNKQDANKTAEQSELFDRLAEILKKNPDLQLDIFGHTCNVGPLDVNKQLGLRRAKWAKLELTKRGVSDKQIECQSKWYSEPLFPNNSAANRAKNRRFEIKRK